MEENNQQSFHDTFFGYHTLYLTSWKVHNLVSLWPQQVQLPMQLFLQLQWKSSKCTCRSLFEVLWKEAPSMIFLNHFNQIWRTQIWKTRFGGCLCFFSKFFVFYIQLSCIEIYIKILFDWFGSYLICLFYFQAEVDQGHL